MSMTFGIVLTPRSGADWAREAAAVEQQGYRTILLPDTRFTPSPFPALAAAAAVTTTIRLRPNVLAAPLRTAAATVRETAALQLLSDGRFELGIGSGRPDAAAEAQWLGTSWGSPAQRRAQLVATIAAVRAGVNPTPPVVVAANGPRMLATAAEFADRILLAAAPGATESELAELVRTARDGTDRTLRFTHQVVGIGQRLPIWTATKLGLTAAALADAGAAGMIPAEPSAAAEILERRREKYGIDEVIVPAELAADFAPILAYFADHDS
ncbi:LLM class flavin-dependent oxidoreductase [Nocardia sp. NPDC059691]|uniref:LLM class flavin-dependent oxidoreductase n=1 Tax=Nocardia sp. NPDC059691 TaxID=3346908 RepID=UPI003695F497